LAPRTRQQSTRKLPLWLIVLTLVVGTVLVLRTRTVWDGLCTQARRQLPTLLGLEVGIGQCEVDPLGQRLVLRGVSVFEKGSETPLLAADLAASRNCGRGQALGCRLAVLTASDEGIGIYRRLGFREYCRFRRYEWESG